MSPTINGGMEISPDAYLPAGVYSELGIDNAQDLYVRDHTVYVADSGNQRILVLDTANDTATAVGEGLLTEPKGVAADEEGRIYVADPGAGLAFRFSPRRAARASIRASQHPELREKHPVFPAENRGRGQRRVYIISEDSKTGIIHMDGTGEFLGFFASNDVKKEPV